MTRKESMPASFMSLYGWITLSSVSSHGYNFPLIFFSVKFVMHDSLASDAVCHMV
jgi:hypothetical protein